MGGHTLEGNFREYMSHDGNSTGRGNLHMEIPWTGPNFKWKFHGEGLI